MTYIPTKLKFEIEIDAIITMHYFEYMKDFVFKGETHNFWEFLYVDKGTVSVCSDTDWFELNTGDIIFHKPNEFHAIKSIGKEPPNLVAISFISQSPAMTFFEHRRFTLTRKERELISLMIAEAGKTFSTPMHVPSIEQVQIKELTPFASQQLIQLYLELFLITAVRNHPREETERVIVHNESPQRKSSRHEQLQEIVQYMEYHICEQLTITDICNNFSISRSSLQALFHTLLNCGVIDYFNHMKIERAKDIIRDGTMNFTEIAYFLSFNSLPYFSKRFKATTGMSPSEYLSSVKGMTENLRKQVEEERKIP